MKNNDQDLIIGLTKKTKDYNNTLNKKINNSNVSYNKPNILNNTAKTNNLSNSTNIALINKIINYIRNKGQPCSRKEIISEFKSSELSIKDLILAINNSQKLKYDDKKDVFELKSKYNISNIEQLKELIKCSSENGIPLDEELKDSYPNIINDLELLKKDNNSNLLTNKEKEKRGNFNLRLIYNEEKKFDVLFYRDLNDPIENILTDKSYYDALTEIRYVFNELKHYEGLENYMPVLKKKTEKSTNYMLLKKKKKFIRGKHSNTHLNENR